MTTSDSGYGWTFPQDGDSDLTAAALVFRSLLARVDTIKVVKVTAVNPGDGTPPTAGTVDVQILVSQIDGATPPNATPHGTVYGLPYFRLRYGPWEIVGDPVVGAIGLALVSDRDISKVKNTKAQAAPGSQRRFSVADGLFVPFGSFFDGAPSAYAWLKGDGTLNVKDKSGNSLVSSTSGWALTDKNNNSFVSNASGWTWTGPGNNNVAIDAAGIHLNGTVFVNGVMQGATPGAAVDLGGANLTTTGDVTAGGKSLKTHTHTQPPDSHGDTEAATSAPV